MLTTPSHFIGLTTLGLCFCCCTDNSAAPSSPSGDCSNGTHASGLPSSGEHPCAVGESGGSGADSHTGIMDEIGGTASLYSVSEAGGSSGKSGSGGAPSTSSAGGGDERACPGSYPSPECTGIPRGTLFSKTVNGDYMASKDGEVIDSWHITGQLVVTGNNVTVSNSQIDGFIAKNDKDFRQLMVRDTTIGPETGCLSGQPGIDTGYDTGNYTAVRVLIRGHDDGFRAGGPNITIRDSFVKNCGTPESHSDGIQDFPYTTNLVFTHNTIDMCGTWTTDRTQPPCPAQCEPHGCNSPIFINSDRAQGNGSTQVVITDNLVMGGVFSLYLKPELVGHEGTGGTWIVKGNRVVDGTWVYGPYETNGQCANVAEWSDNTVVTMDESYQVTSTVRAVGCPD